jgi:hypothetical protein
MKLSPRSGWSFVLNTLSFWVLVRVAHSYLQPGGTSFLLKILISCLVGVVLVFRRFSGSIRLLLARLLSRRAKKKISSEQSPLTPDKGESSQKQGRPIR